MANTIDWGKATQNNTNGFGKYQNTIGAASVYAVSAAGETVIEGTSAAFTYAKSSYHQDESDPTPTITGTSGGTFSGTSGIVFVDSGTNSGSSTGQVDLSASTIQANTITYTVSGVSANFSLSVTASPFLANTYSMEFDGVDDYVETGYTIPSISEWSVSFWVNIDDASNSNYYYHISARNSSTTGLVVWSGNGTSSSQRNFSVKMNSTTITFSVTSFSTWYNIIITGNGSNLTAYVDGVQAATTADSTLFPTLTYTTKIGSNKDGTNYFFNGKIDETAIWNTALSSDAVQEIYNATNNNSGKALDLSTDSGNYSSSSNLQYWNRMGD